VSLDSGELEGMLRAAPHADGIAARQALAEVESALFDRAPRPVTLSRYVLLDPLGAGGSGLVLRAYDPQLDRKIAVKLLQAPRRAAEIDTDGRLRLLREAQSLARLSHPNVIAVHDVGTYSEDDLGGLLTSSDVPPRGVFMVMELVDGPTLREWMVTPRTWREALAVMIPAAEGLIAAHGQELVHRDFKPANVLVGSDGRVRVLDFGLARPTGDSGSAPLVAPVEDQRAPERITRTGVVMGTPLYMAPEQHVGTRADEQSDQFSFCACLYEIVYRTRPYQGEGLSGLYEAKREGPRPPSATRGIPRGLRAAIARGLSPDPKDRFGSMADLRDELERVRSQRRRIATVSAVAGFGLLAVVTVQLSASDDACRAHEQQLDDVWDEPRKARLRASFVASDATSADESWELTAALVDEYAGQWTQRRHEACRNAVTGQSTPDTMEATVQCLDRRLSGLRETLDVLSAGDADTVRNAPAAIAQLIPLSTCDNLDAEPHDALPPDGPRREQVREVAQRVDRARALQAAARFDDAIGELDSAIETAIEAEHAPSEVRARLERANMLQKNGTLDDAASETQRALLVAERSGDRAAVDEVLVWRVALDGYLRAQHDAGDRLVEQLEARFAHQAPTPKVAMSFESSVALLRNAQGRLDEALVRVRAALELRAQMRPTQLANALNLEANILLSQGDLEGARAGHERALARRKALFGQTHGTTAESISNLALVDQLSGDLEAAVEGLELALSIQRKVWGPGHVNLASTFNNLGVTWGKRGDIDKALDYFEQAHELFVKKHGNNHVITARSHANLGAMLNNLGRYDEALERAELAFASLEQVDPAHIVYSEARFVRGLAKLGLGRDEDGRRDVKEARAIYERQEVRDPVREQYLYADLENLLSRDG